jgi:hypothetical protein
VLSKPLTQSDCTCAYALPCSLAEGLVQPERSLAIRGLQICILLNTTERVPEPGRNEANSNLPHFTTMLIITDEFSLTFLDMKSWSVDDLAAAAAGAIADLPTMLECQSTQLLQLPISYCSFRFPKHGSFETQELYLWHRLL